MPRTSPLTGWPVRLTWRRPDRTVIVLRPLTRHDRAEWEALRARNAEYLAPWEAAAPGAEPGPGRYRDLLRAVDRLAGRGRMLPFAIEYEGALAGSMWISDIDWGSLRSGQAGYWVAAEVAGRGVGACALALATDYALGRAGLHRVEVNVQPHNVASLRLVEKVGFRDEGVRRGYQYVAGAWRDHRTFALTAEDVRGLRLVDRVP